MQVSRIVPFVSLMVMALKQSTEVNAVDTLYIVSGIYDIVSFRSGHSGL